MENKKEYLNEEKYQQNVKKIKRTGKILLVIGICMLVLGLIISVMYFKGLFLIETNLDSTQSSRVVFGGVGLFALGGFLGTLGFFMTALGGILLIIAHRREITAFTTQQVMPIAQEGIEKMTPTVGNAAKEVAKGIKEGLKDDSSKKE